MKKNVLMYALFLSMMSLSISHRATAQESTARVYEGHSRIDSLADVNRKKEAAKEEGRRNSENLSDLKSERTETKANAKDAQRVENEASDAARQSKIAYRQEKKAQKARSQADKQAKKASKARTKSDKN